MNESMLLTGAGGFTGRHLRALASRQGMKVSALEADLTDRNAVMEELRGRSFDYVVHLGAISYVGHGDATAFYTVNVIGTQNLLDAVLSSNGAVKKVLVASSANVYGNSEKGVISERDTPMPVNHYANSKLAMEHLVRTYFDKLPIVVVRPFNYTGAGQDSRFVIPKIVDHFKRRADVVELGNTQVVREYNDVRFVCDTYLKLLGSDIRSGLLNICTSKGYSLSDVITELNTITGHSIEVAVNPDFVRPNEIHTLLGDNSRLVETLGELRKYHLSETLKQMLEEY